MSALHLQGGLAAVTSWLRLELVVVTDRRVNLMSEILGAIRLIKMYGWEDSFRAKVRLGGQLPDQLTFYILR